MAIVDTIFRNGSSSVKPCSYDADNRTTQIALRSGINVLQSFAYGYDAVGNRTSVTENGNPSTYTVNNLNQYTAVSGTNFSYNNAGQLTGDGTWTYGYDNEGHLTSAAKAGTTITYSYDTQGRRIGKAINGVAAAKYVYNGNDLIEERDGAGTTVTAAYFYAGGVDQPVGVIKGGNAYYFQQDALGNVASLTDASGSLVEQYSYDVYGKPTIKDGSGNVKTTAMTPFLFTGREYDSETGLYHNRARAYSPVLGRFLSRDPLDGAELSQGPNLYAYVANDPVNRVDPSGSKTCWKKMLITGYNDATGAFNHNPLGKGDAAAGNRGYKSSDFDSKGSVLKGHLVNKRDMAYSRGTKFTVYGGDNGGAMNVKINDNGAGYAEPRPKVGAPNGVSADEWLDVWTNKDIGTHWDWVSTEVGDGCNCPSGWLGD